MTDAELEQIEERMLSELHYTKNWPLPMIHAARLDRHALLWEVKRLRRRELEFTGPKEQEA